MICLACSLDSPVHTACYGRTHSGGCDCTDDACLLWREAKIAELPELHVGELISAMETVIQSVGVIEGRRIVRKVRAWSEQKESELTVGVRDEGSHRLSHHD